MKLMTPAEFADKFFTDDSKPTQTTIIRWLKAGELPGRAIGGRWYVDTDALPSSSNPLVNSVLRAS